MKQPVCVFFAAGRTGAGGETAPDGLIIFFIIEKTFSFVLRPSVRLRLLIATPTNQFII
jgi:hypothetical protein